jgi:hypothetical protein
MTFFIWKGAIFRVPISTLQSCKAGGGWELLDIHVKCRALLPSRMHSQNARAGLVQAFWLRKWNLDTHPANPPNVAAYPLACYICERTQRTWPMYHSPSRTTRSKITVHAYTRRCTQWFPLHRRRDHVGWRRYTPTSTGTESGATYIPPGSQALYDPNGTWQSTISCPPTSVFTGLPLLTPPTVPTVVKSTPCHTD